MIPTINVVETGKNIKHLMMCNGVTPTNIKTVCGFSTVQPVYHWIHGRNLPTVDNLLILSYLFDCSVESILVYDKQ